MQLEVICPACGKSFRVPDYLANRYTMCPHCGHALTVNGKPVAPPRIAATTPPARFPVASALVGLFRFLAVLVGLMFLLLIALGWEAATKLGAAGWASVLLQALGGIGAVALLLAIAEGLKLGIAIEVNTHRWASSLKHPAGEVNSEAGSLPDIEKESREETA